MIYESHTIDLRLGINQRIRLGCLLIFRQQHNRIVRRRLLQLQGVLGWCLGPLLRAIKAAFSPTAGSVVVDNYVPVSWQWSFSIETEWS